MPEEDKPRSELKLEPKVPPAPPTREEMQGALVKDAEARIAAYKQHKRTLASKLGVRERVMLFITQEGHVKSEIVYETE